MSQSNPNAPQLTFVEAKPPDDMEDDLVVQTLRRQKRIDSYDREALEAALDALYRTCDEEELKTSEPLPDSGKPSPILHLPYMAFRVEPECFMLELRLACGIGMMPAYHGLLQVRANRLSTMGMLVFNHMVVVIQGKHLDEIITAVECHTCDFLQEFNPQVFFRPKDGRPIIERIRRFVIQELPAGKGEQ